MLKMHNIIRSLAFIILQQFYPKFIVKLQQNPITIGFLSEIYCKITINSDYIYGSIRNLLQNCNKFRFGQIKGCLFGRIMVK